MGDEGFHEKVSSLRATINTTQLKYDTVPFPPHHNESQRDNFFLPSDSKERESNAIILLMFMLFSKVLSLSWGWSGCHAHAQVLKMLTLWVKIESFDDKKGGLLVGQIRMMPDPSLSGLATKGCYHRR